MKVLSLFDGMSCGRIALERAGITVDAYYAAEIDKHAVKVSQANWPDIVQLGDVTKWKEWSIDWSSIDLLIGGSPCQGFSFAGKQLAFDDPRSKLFFVYVDILNHIRSVNPSVKFMLENVKMKKEHLAVISETLGVEPVFINSALVSAQNRQRYYWANWKITQPEDKGVVLADVIESEPLETTVMSEAFTTRNRHILRDDFSGKAKSLSAMEYVKNGRQGDYIRCASMVGRRINPETGKRDDYNESIVAAQTIEIRADEKTNCLTSVQKDNLLVLGASYRKLTPIECERLQTVPDNYTAHVSNTQRYKMLGNGWTVDVIAHIFKCMNQGA